MPLRFETKLSILAESRQCGVGRGGGGDREKDSDLEYDTLEIPFKIGRDHRRNGGFGGGGGVPSCH